MVTKQQVKNGMLKYLDSEVIPNLPSAGKWVSGTAIVLASANFDKIYNKLIHSDVATTLGVVQDNLVDIDSLASAMRHSADKYGKMELSIPIVGHLYFSSSDVEKLRQFINAEAAQ